MSWQDEAAVQFSPHTTAPISAPDHFPPHSTAPFPGVLDHSTSFLDPPTRPSVQHAGTPASVDMTQQALSSSVNASLLPHATAEQPWKSINPLHPPLTSSVSFETRPKQPQSINNHIPASVVSHFPQHNPNDAAPPTTNPLDSNPFAFENEHAFENNLRRTASPEIVPINDDDPRAQKVHPLSPIEVSPPQKKRKTSFALSDVINVDDDNELQQLAQLNANNNIATQPRPPSVADAMAPTFAQPNRLFIGRGGGMFKTVDENTLELVDTDDEDIFVNNNLIVSDENGMSVLNTNAATIPGQTTTNSTALEMSATGSDPNQSHMSFPNGAITPITTETANISGISFPNSQFHSMPSQSDAFEPSSTLNDNPFSAHEQVTSDALAIAADNPQTSVENPLQLISQPTAPVIDADEIALDEIIMPFIPNSDGMMPSDLMEATSIPYESQRAFQSSTLSTSGVRPVNITPAPGSHTDAPAPVTSKSTSLTAGGGGMSQEGLRTLLKQNGVSADATEEAESPKQLTVQLMPHQRRGLAWMTKREKPLDEDVVATDDECLGGILADDQGLGKTLTMIALMVSSPPQSQNKQLDATTVSLDNDDLSANYPDGPREDPYNPAWRTLIICPLSLISQWKDEIRNRVKRQCSPAICVYHGPRRERDIKKLREYDIVITTYATLANEYPKILKDHPEFEMRKSQKLKPPRRRPGPLFKVSWYRVVLDEAQYVKNRSTDCWGAVMSLDSERRWCLSGTPIQNNVDDLYSLFCFIRYKCVQDYETWNVQWKKPLESSHPKLRERTFKRFQTIVGVVLLRRTKKDKIDGKPLIMLPERKTEVHDSKFYDAEEEAMYRAVQMKTVVTVNKFLVDGTLAMNYSSVLLLLLRLRQACSHPFLIQYARMQGCRNSAVSEASDRYSTPYSEEDLEEALELVSGGHSLLEMLDESVRERISKLLEPALKGHSMSEAFGCTRCQETTPWKQGWVLPCGHMFCTKCLDPLRERQSCTNCDFNVGTADEVEVFLSIEDLRKEIHARIVVGSKGQLEAISAAEFRDLVHEELQLRQARNRKDQEATKSGGGTTVHSVKQESDGQTKKTETGIVNCDEINVKIEPENSLLTPENIVHRTGTADVKEEKAIVSDVTADRQESPQIGVDQKIEPVIQKTAMKPDVMEVVSDDDSLYELPIGQWRRRAGSSEACSPSDEPLVQKKSAGSARRESKAKVNNGKSSQKRSNKNTSSRKQSTKSKAGSGMPEDQKRKLLDAFSQPSTKIRIILDELNKIREDDETQKTLIFSQWTSMLDIIQFHIQVNGHGVCRLDGTMALCTRQQQIEEFKRSKLKNVFLISLHAGGTGLNLTVASRVILADVWWNPAVEEQAIDRVHRIGQTKSVYVSRFKITGTVEERIYSICARKRELVDGALGVTGAQSLGRQKLSMQELMYLFGGAAEEVARTAEEGTDAARAASNILNFAGSYSLQG